MGKPTATYVDELPRLLEPRSIGLRRIRQHLHYLSRWQAFLRHHWSRALPGERPDRVASAVEDVISFALLTAFIEQFDEEFADSLRVLPRRRRALTSTSLLEIAAASASNQLLAAVLRPFHSGPDLPIPRAILESRWLDRIASELWKTYASRIPVTVFGDFHQLAMSTPIHPRPDSDRLTSRRGDRGAHYTPAPLVDYLTCRTLTLTDADAQARGVEERRILDPSCGCGAFLVAALRHQFRSCTNVGSSPRERRATLSLQEKLDLLETTIFGSDLDGRAVEWTRRVLLLTVWELCLGDGTDMKGTRPRIPTLQQNIIARDFLAEDDPPGRPDIILGGPPFISLANLHKIQPRRIPEYRRRFEVARRGQFDLYMLFIEKAIRLLGEFGTLGFSVSSSFLRSDSGRSLREYIAQHAHVQEVVEFADNRIYPDATTQIALLVLSNTPITTTTRHVVVQGHGRLRQKLNSLIQEDASRRADVEVHMLPCGAFAAENWRFASDGDAVPPTEQSSVVMAELPIEVRMGVSTGADDVFLLTSVSHEYGGRIMVARQSGGAPFEIESAAVRTVLRGRDIRAYSRPVTTTVCVFPYDEELDPLPEQEFKKRLPLAHGYLMSKRSKLRERRAATEDNWYHFGSPPVANVMSCPRILAAGINDGKGFTLDSDGDRLCASSVLIIRPRSSDWDCHYLLGVLNSQALSEWIQTRSPDLGAGRTVLRVRCMQQFPVVLPDTPSLASESAKIAEMAKQLLDADLDVKERDILRTRMDDAVRGIYRDA